HTIEDIGGMAKRRGVDGSRLVSVSSPPRPWGWGTLGARREDFTGIPLLDGNCLKSCVGRGWLESGGLLTRLNTSEDSLTTTDSSTAANCRRMSSCCGPEVIWISPCVKGRNPGASTSTE